ncbi:helix-turn-helix domain-containing protein [Streptomyces sp. NPDC096097]|uniref:PucR family transcriptional regulator n=1 Tax=Streptomyces sp. NPDC096097 TaxID=3155546 RepID=UPI003316AD71
MQVRALAMRRHNLDGELATVPDDAPLIRAHADTAAAADTVRRARTRRDERAAEVTGAAEQAASATADLRETAADLGLPSGRSEPAAVRQALAELDVVLAGLRPALRERSEASRQADDEREEAVRAGEWTAELAVRAEEATREVAAADERLATLRSTVGAAVAELERLLAETTDALRGCAADRQRAQGQYMEADRPATGALTGEDLGLSCQVGNHLCILVPIRGHRSPVELVGLVVEELRRVGVSFGAPAGTVTAARTELSAAIQEAARIEALVNAAGLEGRTVESNQVISELAISRDGDYRRELISLITPIADAPELLKTLRTLYVMDLDRTRTARRLNVARRTLTYRLEKIEQLTGINPVRTRGILAFVLALAAQDLDRTFVMM